MLKHRAATVRTRNSVFSSLTSWCRWLRSKMLCICCAVANYQRQLRMTARVYRVRAGAAHLERHYLSGCLVSRTVHHAGIADAQQLENLRSQETSRQWRFRGRKQRVRTHLEVVQLHSARFGSVLAICVRFVGNDHAPDTAAVVAHGISAVVRIQEGNR